MGYSVEEWSALPWWQQEVYIEGFVDEELLEIGESSPEEPDPVTASSKELRDMGLRVIEGGKT